MATRPSPLISAAELHDVLDMVTLLDVRRFDDLFDDDALTQNRRLPKFPGIRL